MVSKKISLLGSTGSIGQTTLRVAKHLGLEVNSLAAFSRRDLLDKQAEEFGVKKKILVKEKGVEALCELAQDPEVDTVVIAISGSAAISPTLEAARAGKRIALASKEALVAAGALIMKEVKKGGAELIPLDSEHSALFQCLQGNRDLRRLILTASGGPFWTYEPATFNSITVEDALRHPNWAMGAKITVDSSTHMNKGLEIIEAHHLFNVPLENIEVVVHPQSIVHSMVEFVDGATLAKLSNPDMALPIQYALTYPERRESFLKPFDWTRACKLEFFPPDMERFPALRLAYYALKEKGSLPCFMNAANEVLVARFLRGEIKWIEIISILERLMTSHRNICDPDLETLLAIDDEARRQAERY